MPVVCPIRKSLSLLILIKNQKRIGGVERFDAIKTLLENWEKNLYYINYWIYLENFSKLKAKNYKFVSVFITRMGHTPNCFIYQKKIQFV